MDGWMDEWIDGWIDSHNGWRDGSLGLKGSIRGFIKQVLF